MYSIQFCLLPSDTPSLQYVFPVLFEVCKLFFTTACDSVWLHHHLAVCWCGILRLFVLFGFITKIGIVFELSYLEYSIFRVPRTVRGWVFALPRRAFGRLGNSLMGSLAWGYTTIWLKCALGRGHWPSGQHGVDGATKGRALLPLDRSRIFRHRGKENRCLSEIWIYNATRGGAGVGRSSHTFITSSHFIPLAFVP